MMKNIYLVAQEFKWPLNCGALARAAANFGVKNLVFVNPLCNPVSKEAKMFAKHAKGLLDKAIVLKNFNELFKKFDYVIATTSMLGTDYNITRSPLTPEQLALRLPEIKNKKVAIIIGREGEGMSNKEIEKCDFVVTIPSSTKYPTLNVTHAAAILLYEIFKHSNKRNVISHIKPANKEEKTALFKLIKSKVQGLSFETEKKRMTQYLIWKRLLGKSFLTKREINALFGFFKKIKP